jgi:hypothetical protein
MSSTGTIAGGALGTRPVAAGAPFALGLAAVTLLGLLLRLVWLWPPARAVVQAPYDDEGVYVMAAQLLRQGSWPYRDYFFAHPPLGIVALLPAVSVAFTPWGSALSFGLARLLMAGLGGLTVTVVGLGGARLWGPAGGLAAALLLAVDPASVANSRHVLLEVPMTLLVAAALVASAGSGRDRPLLAGGLAGLAALVKVQALALALALALVYAGRRQWRALARLGLGLALAGVLLLPVALVAGPDQMVRQMVLFQLLRPGDGLTTLPERLAALLAPGGLLLGLLGAALGLALAGAAGLARPAGRWLPVAVWVGLGLAGFLLSRSFYQHYTSQLMPGLALLAGGLGAVGSGQRHPHPRPLPRGGRGDRERVGEEVVSAHDDQRAGRVRVQDREGVVEEAVSALSRPAPSPAPRERAGGEGISPASPLRLAAGAALAGLVGLAAVGLAPVVAPRPDPIFATVARYVADAVPPAGTALTTDAQFNVLASRALPRAAGGYLVDSYGQLVYAGLGLGEGRLAEAALAAWRGRAGVTVDEVIWRPAAQALLREHMAAAEVVVVHAVGQRRLTPATRAWLGSQFRLAEQTSRYDIYRRGR